MNYFIYVAVIMSIVLIIYVVYYAYVYLKRKEDIKKETIISTIGEPYLMEESISPFTVELTADVKNENGGLSYLHDYTHEKNIKMVKDLYKEKHITIPEDTHIIFGAGATMMVAALYYALHKKLNKTIRVTTNANVFYYLHKNLTYTSNNIQWVSPEEPVDLYVIVSPSNPLGVVTSPTEFGDKYKLFDVVYDKEFITGLDHTVNPDLYKQFAVDNTISITSSFSKNGVPGARFGYLLTRDPEIAAYCEEYVKINSIRYPTAGSVISRLGYYKYFNKPEWKHYISTEIKRRREFFYKNAEKHGIQIYSKNVLVPYIYTDKSVDWWLDKFNVETRKGSDFNDTDNHSRFNLMLSTEYWNEFERRFS